MEVYSLRLNSLSFVLIARWISEKFSENPVDAAADDRGEPRVSFRFDRRRQFDVRPNRTPDVVHAGS